MNDELLTNTQDAAAEAEGLLGAAATLAGVAITCVVNSPQTTEELMMGGRLVKLALFVVATRDQTAFETITPTIGQLFVYQRVTYKVVSASSDDINWQFACVQPSQ